MSDGDVTAKQLVDAVLKANYEAAELLTRVLQAKGPQDLAGLTTTPNNGEAVQLGKQIDAAKFLLEHSPALLTHLANMGGLPRVDGRLFQCPLSLPALPCQPGIA